MRCVQRRDGRASTSDEKWEEAARLYYLFNVGNAFIKFTNYETSLGSVWPEAYNDFSTSGEGAHSFSVQTALRKHFKRYLMRSSRSRRRNTSRGARRRTLYLGLRQYDNCRICVFARSRPSSVGSV